MGSGTDVAKDTASLIVTDDDFASIVAGIEEGRYAYDNVRKVVYLLISTGFAEVLLHARPHRGPSVAPPCGPLSSG